ncbi:hypothetical protein Bca52824_096326 [Brassica carinata]|uniref:Uncharacterized protein n=1 Tax=Brassica carinata TaxID=52824 RepID=A0A8X7TH33_BRACI|nr:hypothetical protein Bca52824_096326 [Brassica carinata]
MDTLPSEVDLLNSSPNRSRMRIIGLALDDPRTLPLKFKTRNVGRVFVAGYDTKLPHDDVESALGKLFSSCGQVTDIFIRQIDKKLARRAIVYILGKSAADKALLLSGSDVGGWKAIVTPYRFPESAGRHIAVSVTGYDNSLSDIESAMRQHFSSCGEISDFDIYSASVGFNVDGEDAQDKVMDLDGSDMGGRTLHVQVIAGAIITVHTKRHSQKRF